MILSLSSLVEQTVFQGHTLGLSLAREWVHVYNNINTYYKVASITRKTSPIHTVHVTCIIIIVHHIGVN